METWQSEFIRKNLPFLIEVTQFNREIIRILIEENVLSTEDVQIQDALQEQTDPQRAYRYYRLLISRGNCAYEKLVKALHLTCQTGAVQALLDGMRKNGITDPLTRCEIYVSKEYFGCSGMIIGSRYHELHDLRPAVDLQELQKICQQLYSEIDYFDQFVKKPIFVLVSHTLPNTLAIYMHRIFSTTNVVRQDIFTLDIPDIFVFKGITRLLFSKLCKIWSKNSSEVVDGFNGALPRFIILDREDHWHRLYSIHRASLVPVHLIRYISDGFFALECSYGDSRIIEEKSPTRSFQLTEDELITRHTNNIGNICITGTPKLGKTAALASIARQMESRCPERIIAYVELPKLMEIVARPLTTDHKNTLLSVFKLISPSNETATIFLYFIEKKSFNIQLFIDGIDEIENNDRVWFTGFLKEVTQKISNVAVTITCGPNLTKDLEDILETTSYELQPFDKMSKITYLADAWSEKIPNSIPSDLTIYAEKCLQFLEKTATEKEKAINGIPIVYNFISNLYVDQAQAFIQRGSLTFPFTFRVVYNMYEDFAGDQTQVADYKITYTDISTNKLGEGINGTVFKGRLGSSNVAVKVISRFKNLNQARNEIKILVECADHPNIVRYLAFEENKVFGFILALELCHPCTLGSWIKNPETVRLDSVEILRQTTEGLAFLHLKNIVHRDLKPLNILFSLDQRFVKIADFGLSRQLDMGRNTKTYTSIGGTRGYTAAEMLEAEEKFELGETSEIPKLTKEIDIFSLGCIFYFVLTKGKHPFGNKPRLLEHNISEGLIQFENFYECPILSNILPLIETMIARDPTERPTIDQVSTELFSKTAIQ